MNNKFSRIVMPAILLTIAIILALVWWSMGEAKEPSCTVWYSAEVVTCDTVPLPTPTATQKPKREKSNDVSVGYPAPGDPEPSATVEMPYPAPISGDPNETPIPTSTEGWVMPTYAPHFYTPTMAPTMTDTP